jgi:DNA-directed RNA polymerase specialized sigma24 family protein
MDCDSDTDVADDVVASRFESAGCSEDAASEADDPSRKHEVARRMERFLAEFGQLTKLQRNVLYMSEGLQRSALDIARELHLTPRQVRYAYHEGLNVLSIRLAGKPAVRRMPRGSKKTKRDTA